MKLKIILIEVNSGRKITNLSEMHYSKENKGAMKLAEMKVDIGEGFPQKKG